ncbi:antitoxin [Candidatus Poribacteria bacterium]|nr:MAG: antitoxin [Candidatus Poribacteria bacterium]
MRLSEKWIISDPKILGGKPVIRGTRISVSFILKCLASGMTVDDILEGYPHLTREGVLAAIEYAAEVMEGEKVLPIELLS